VISIKSKHLAVIVPAVFAAGIGLTIAFNLWKTETTKVPAAYASGEFAGKANPADIRGSYTFADIVKAFPVPLEELARAFGVTENPAAFQVKSLEGASEGLPAGKELGTDSVRLFVARYAGLPFEPGETTVLPAAAVEILAKKGGFSAEQLADLQARAVGAELTAAEPAAVPAAKSPAAPAPTTTAPAATTAAPAPSSPAAAAAPAASGTESSSATHTTSSTERTVKGTTTFKDLADWGVAEADIRKVFGGDLGASGTTLKDYCTAKGIEFSTVKTAVQDLVTAAAP
jgi:hypothetical protein